jgi:ABC-type uncharacterized transport system substrate-binding protein
MKRMNKKFIIFKSKPTFLSLLFLFTALLSFIVGCDKKRPKTKQKSPNQKIKITQKKILYVGSYHSGNFWSDGITAGIKKIISTRNNIQLKIFRMNTKRFPEENFKKNAALKAKEIIDSWKPDLVITSDDNAAKYLIKPYFVNTELPFVFCGINWDASIYGLPCKNVTGMIEISLVKDFIKTIKPYSKGDKIGYIAPNTTSAKQVLKQNQRYIKITQENIKLVNSFAEWKKAYLQLQNTSNILLMANWQGIKDWNEIEAIKFVYKNTKIPSGSFYKDIAKYTLACFSNYPSEQGEWAAKTALKILDGEKPNQIKQATNKKAEILLNMKLAKKMNVFFSTDLLNIATLID